MDVKYRVVRVCYIYRHHLFIVFLYRYPVFIHKYFRSDQQQCDSIDTGFAWGGFIPTSGTLWKFVQDWKYVSTIFAIHDGLHCA